MATTGHDRKELDDGRLRFDGPDRRELVIVTPVETHSGSVFNCILYRSENPYGWGKQITSAIAETEADIEPTVEQLFSG